MTEPEACYTAQTAGRGPAHGKVPEWCIPHESRWPKDRWLCDKMMADLALAAAVRRMPRTVWLGRVPEGWCVLTDDGTDEGKPHIAADPLAAIAAALEDKP